jgi:hypothetical protein
MQDAPISRTRYVQENRKMRFQEADEGWREGRLSQAEAALLLGQCERSFRRHISCIASALAMQLDHLQQPPRSINLQPPGLPNHWYGGRGQVNLSRPQTLFKSFEDLGINLKVFAPNAFPLALSPTLSQISQTARKSEASERTRQYPNP